MTFGTFTARSLFAAAIVCSMSLQACGGGNASPNRTDVVPGPATTKKVSAAALDVLLKPRHLISSKGKFSAHDISTLKYTLDFSIPASNATVLSSGITQWYALSGNYSLQNVGTVNVLSAVGVNAAGDVVWEVDGQSSQSLGLARISTSSGAYFGAWTNGTLNVAQATNPADATNGKALQNDLNWALSGFPSNPVKPGGTPKPKIAPKAVSSNGWWLAASGLVDWDELFYQIAPCTVSLLCTAALVGSIAENGLGGVEQYVNAYASLHNGLIPTGLAPPSGDPQDPFLGVVFTPVPGEGDGDGGDGSFSVVYCDDEGCILDYTDVHRKE